MVEVEGRLCGGSGSGVGVVSGGGMGSGGSGMVRRSGVGMFGFGYRGRVYGNAREVLGRCTLGSKRLEGILGPRLMICHHKAR